MSAKTYFTSSSAVLEAFREARRIHGDHFVDQALREAELGLCPAPYLVLDDSGSSRKLAVAFPDPLISWVSTSGSSGPVSSSPN